MVFVQSLRSRLLSSVNDVLVAFDFLRPVASNVLTRNALPHIPPQQIRLTERLIAVDRLSLAAVLTRCDEIPAIRLADW
jgi:hypothetical protein